MNRVLRKRLLRDFRSNFMRYLALIALTTMGMFVVISIVGAAETIIRGTEEKNIENHVEDGRFTVFIPLTAKQESKLRDTGITLEKMFSIDLDAEDGSTIRFMKDRKAINMVDLDCGHKPEKMQEIVLEKRYCEEHQIKLGDKITLEDCEFSVVGIGSSSDYDMPMKNSSDVAIESTLFGLGFVTDEQYTDVIRKTGSLAEDYCYAYLLNNQLTNEELKQIIKDLEFYYEDVADPYFQEMICDITDTKKELREGVNDLQVGALDISEGATDLKEGSSDLKDGAIELQNNVGKLRDGASELDTGASDLHSGTVEVQDALTKLDSNSASLTSGSAEVREALGKIQTELNSGGNIDDEDLDRLSEASSSLRQGVHSVNDGIVQLKEAIDFYDQALTDAGMGDIDSFIGWNQGVLDNLALDFDTNESLCILLSADISYIQGSHNLISSIRDALDESSGQLRQGAVAIQNGCDEFDDSIQTLVEQLRSLSGNLEELKNGINTLSSEYVNLDDGIHTYVSSVSEIKDGSTKLVDGAKELKDGTGELNSKTADFQNGADELLDGTEELCDGTTDLAEGTDELKDGTDEFKTKTDETIDEYFVIDIDNLMTFTIAKDNSRIAAAAGDVLMQKLVGLIAGVIIMILFTYVISIFVIHQIQSECSVIGSLYALGVKKKNLMLHYITLPTLISFLGGIFGALLGFSQIGIPNQMKDSYAYFSIPIFRSIYPAYLIIYSVVMPPLVSIIVNFFVINKRLSQTALSLIRNEQKAGKQKQINLRNKNFIRNFQIRQMLKESRSGVAIIFAMIISLLITMLGVDCYILCVHYQKEIKQDTTYEYMYNLKYPEEESPLEGETCYSESLSKSYLGFTLDVTVMGIDDDNPYYPAETVKGKSKVVIAKSVQEKYALNIGDKLILSDPANELDYVFTIEDVCDYTAGLIVFMDIDSMRELFGQEDDYYNVILSKEPIQIEEGRLYSVITKQAISSSADIFVDMMMPMIILLVGVSIAIFVIVMYLMMTVMIDRAGFGISLVKIFGYRSVEINKLYLNGNGILVAISALIGIPIAKALADSMYPWLIANVAQGMNLSFPWYLYVGIFIAIMLIYRGINLCLVWKLNQISPVEVLKNRE